MSPPICIYIGYLNIKAELFHGGKCERCIIRECWEVIKLGI